MDVEQDEVLECSHDESWALEMDQQEEVVVESEQQQLPPQPHFKYLSRDLPTQYIHNACIFDAIFVTVDRKMYPREACLRLMPLGERYFNTIVKPIKMFGALSHADQMINNEAYDKYHGIAWTLDKHRDENTVYSYNNLLRMFLENKYVIVNGKDNVNYLRNIISIAPERIIIDTQPFPEKLINNCSNHINKTYRCAYKNCETIYKHVLKFL